MTMDQADHKNKQETETRINVGVQIKTIRKARSISLKKLAEMSGLNINTLSLVENGKISPSINTLYQISNALGISIVTLFQADNNLSRIVYTRSNGTSKEEFGASRLENLCQKYFNLSIQTFRITLKPGDTICSSPAVHPGHEYIYCLKGKIRYTIDQQVFMLEAGDSLIFESTRPHYWENATGDEAQFLLVIHQDEFDQSVISKHTMPLTTEHVADTPTL